LLTGVSVPNVVGMKIDLARFYLRTAGFSTVPLNQPCDKGTLPSQSVVASLSIPGTPPKVTVGARPLAPGTLLPKASPVGITWSGCYPAGTTVPDVTRHTFPNAVHLLHLAGLNWACYSVGRPTTTTTTQPASTGAANPTSTTTTTPPAAEAAASQAIVIMQGTKAGTAVPAGTVVALIMHHCPQ
jgi:beta-lactam-binding protein with PASTA domain